MRRADIVSGLLLTLLGLISLFAIIPAQIGSAGGQAGVAPDVFPLTLMWLVTGLAALLWVTRLAQRGGKDEPAPFRSTNFFFIACASAVLAVGYFAIAKLGFIAGGALTVALTMLAMDGRRYPIRLVCVSLLAPAAVYGFFRYLFTVLLP